MKTPPIYNSYGSHPKISVILPSVNEEIFIERAISSIKNQNYPNLEIIISANGSTDGTIELAKKAGTKIIESQKKLGASKARNDGANIATGEILVFLDADSYIGKEVLNTIARHFGENVFGTVLGRPDQFSVIYGIFFFIKNIFHRLHLYKGALGGLMFFDKKLFQKIEGYNVEMYVDEIYDISKRARAKGGKYRLITGVYAYTSLRRFNKYGTVRMMIFWCKARIMNIMKNRVPGEEEYRAF